MLVALGAALAGLWLRLRGGRDADRGLLVSGSGFLGADVILKGGTHIHGPNTAATLWCSAAGWSPTPGC